MRWLFADPTVPDEAAYVRQKVAAIDHWWQAFQAQKDNIKGVFEADREWNLSKFMVELLAPIHPKIMWEFGPAVQQPGHRLVITPENARWLRPLTATMLRRAPTIPGWEFYAYRLAENAELAVRAVRSRAGVDITKALINASAAPGRKIDLYYSFPDMTDLDEQLARQAAFVATESLMGEHVLDTWIGTIGLAGDEGSAGSLLPLEQTQRTVASIILSLQNQLPNGPIQNSGTGYDWATVKLDPPEPDEDYPGRSDLVVGTTHDVELFQAMHGGFPFASLCHSKVGELFCYLKIDAADPPNDRAAELRSRIEQALNPALAQAGAGCCIGGGNGLRYTYIDLAVTDINKASPVIREVLAQCQAPQRTWLLFHDEDLLAEWIGAYPQTPPPPQEEELE